MDTNSVLSFQASFCVLYKIRCVSYKTGVLKCPHQQVLLYSNNNSTTVQLICFRHCELIHTEDQCSAVAGDIVWIVQVSSVVRREVLMYVGAIMTMLSRASFNQVDYILLARVLHPSNVKKYLPI